MTAITLRIRSDEDHETIERLKHVTHERTTAKALMCAARRYPDARDELKRTLDRLAAVQADHDRLQAALADWQRIHHLEREAWTRLESMVP